MALRFIFHVQVEFFLMQYWWNPCWKHVFNLSWSTLWESYPVITAVVGNQLDRDTYQAHGLRWWKGKVCARKMAYPGSTCHHGLLREVWTENSFAFSEGVLESPSNLWRKMGSTRWSGQNTTWRLRQLREMPNQFWFCQPGRHFFQSRSMAAQVGEAQPVFDICYPWAILVGKQNLAGGLPQDSMVDQQLDCRKTSRKWSVWWGTLQGIESFFWPAIPAQVCPYRDKRRLGLAQEDLEV